MRYALVDDNKTVVNVILLEPDADWQPPDGVEVIRSDTAAIGDRYIRRKFETPDPPAPDPETVRLGELREKIRAQIVTQKELVEYTALRDGLRPTEDV